MLACNPNLILNQQVKCLNSLQIQAQVHTPETGQDVTVNEAFGSIPVNSVDLNFADGVRANEHVDMPDLGEFLTFPQSITPIKRPVVKKQVITGKKIGKKMKVYWE